MKKSPRNTPIRNNTSIVDGWLYFEDVRQAQLDCELFSDIIDHRSTTSIRVVSLASNWHEREWISGVGYMNFDIKLEMTLRAEIRSGRKYWYAYRRAGGHLQKRFVGDSEAVTTERLVKVAQSMG